jgi:hypothetical protein
VALAGVILAGALATPALAAGALDPLISGLRWGESTASVRDHFGKGALALEPPIEFGDAYVDVALRGFRLGGDDYIVYFEMDKAGQGLKRVLLERPRHSANQAAFAAASRILAAELGMAKSCRVKARPGNGYQSMATKIWRSAGNRVRAIFRDTTLESENGCQEIGFLPCGLEGRLVIVIDSEDAADPDCG